LGTVNQQALLLTAGALKFGLSDLPDYTEFTSLFDDYRICAVEVSFVPKFNMLSVTTTSSVITPILVTVLDYDDNNTPSGISDLMEYDSVVVTNFDKSCKRIVCPRWTTAAYSGTSTWSYASNRGWVDAAYPDVYHYGIKYAIKPGASGQTTFNLGKLLQSTTLNLGLFVSQVQNRVSLVIESVDPRWKNKKTPTHLENREENEKTRIYPISRTTGSYGS